MAKVKSRLTKTQLRENMELGIEKMRDILEDDDSGKQEKVQAANAMSGLVNRYKEIFGVAPEGDGELRSVKNF